jgi:hypothetical protein
MAEDMMTMDPLATMGDPVVEAEAIMVLGTT